MRSLADEYKGGTFELLKVLPLRPAEIVWGKFFGALLVILLALVPTVIYAISVQLLSATGGIDVGSTMGSYVGLFMLGAVFTAIGICTSSFTNNTVLAFITGAFICFLLFNGFEAASKLPVFAGTPAYYIEMLGINNHYTSISKGVIDARDVIYFAGLIVAALLVTQKNVGAR
jgi:ABC-2 type transport system permease protein